MKFRYYITDLTEGTVLGTNSRQVADHFSECEDYFVVDAQEGLLIQEGEGVEINDAENRE